EVGGVAVEHRVPAVGAERRREAGAVGRTPVVRHRDQLVHALAQVAHVRVGGGRPTLDQVGGVAVERDVATVGGQPRGQGEPVGGTAVVRHRHPLRGPGDPVVHEQVPLAVGGVVGQVVREAAEGDVAPVGADRGPLGDAVALFPGGGDRHPLGGRRVGQLQVGGGGAPGCHRHRRGRGQGTVVHLGLDRV